MWCAQCATHVRRTDLTAKFQVRVLDEGLTTLGALPMLSSDNLGIFAHLD